MKIKKPEDKFVLEALDIYLSQGNIRPFIEIGSEWILANSRIRCFLDEDESSELFFIFHKKAYHCIESYRKGKYPNFLAYFTVYTKNLERNLARRLRRKEVTEYLNLWENHSTTKKTMEADIEIHLLRRVINSLEDFDRILMLLKFNLTLSLKDKKILFYYLKQNNKCVSKFMIEWESKRDIFFQRKIQKTSSLFFPKDKCLKRRSHSGTLYTYQELGEWFNLPRHTIVRKFNRNFDLLRAEFSQKIGRYKSLSENGMDNSYSVSGNKHTL
ncbi:MAG: hypothetical protein AAF518_13135 [Spirochaetota bacterium]